MRNLLFLLLFITYTPICSAQLYVDILGDRRSKEEEDAIWAEIQQRDRERERAHQRFLEEQERERIRQEKALEKALEDALNKARAQKQREQQKADRNRQIAERNKQVAERNRQIEEENQRIAEENRRRKIEAERRRKEEELRRREETRKRVTAETYQRLETQTRNMQNAAAYASGEGAYRLQQEHNVARYEQQIQPGMGNAVSQISHLPKQKFTLPKNDFVLDPNRIYHLDTWNLSSSEDIGYAFSVPPLLPIKDKSMWDKVVEDIPKNHLMVYLAYMKNKSGNLNPNVTETEEGYAFVSSTGNTIYWMAKDGNSMSFVDLDDPKNAELKREIYAKANSGVKIKGLIDTDKIKGLKFDDNLNIESKRTFGDDDLTVSLKGKATINKEWGRKYEEKKITEDLTNKNEIETTLIAAAVGAKIEKDDMSKFTIGYMRFVTKNVAVTGSVTLEAGSKIKGDISGKSSISTKKMDLNAGAELGIEGLALNISGGYLVAGKNGVYLGTTKVRGGLGASVGGKIGLTSSYVKGGMASVGYDLNGILIPYTSNDFTFSIGQNK